MPFKRHSRSLATPAFLALTLAMSACVEDGTGSSGSVQNGAADAKAMSLR